MRHELAHLADRDGICERESKTHPVLQKPEDKGGAPSNVSSVRDPLQAFFRAAVIAAERQRGAILFSSAAVIALSLE